MLVTPCGMMIDVRLLQSLKAPLPMLVTPSGMVIDVRLLQSLKAASPMLVTRKPLILFGMAKLPTAPTLQSVIAT